MALTKITGEGVGDVDSLSVDGGTIKLDGNYPTGSGNVALGNTALDDGSLSGANNTAVGSNAMTANTSGAANTTVGSLALDANTTGDFNSAFGVNALSSNTTADGNSAYGYQALYSNSTGASNVAAGVNSLFANTTASNNTAVGYAALTANTTGALNTAVGSTALDACTEANYSAAFGYAALGGVTTGSDNSAFGVDAGKRITTGTVNSCFGKGAGEYITTGSKNTVIGRYNGNQGGLDIRTASNNIVLSDGDGNPRYEYVSALGTLVLGRGVTYSTLGTNSGAIQHINRDQTANPSLHPAEDDFTDLGRSSNRFDDIHATNGTIQTSDSRVKENITDSDLGLDFINRLSPKSYTMVGKTRTHYGLVAQDVRTVLGDISKSEANFAGFVDYNTLPADDGQRDLLALRYDEFISPLIQAVKDLKTELDEAKARIAALEAE